MPGILEGEAFRAVMRLVTYRPYHLNIVYQYNDTFDFPQRFCLFFCFSFVVCDLL